MKEVVGLLVAEASCSGGLCCWKRTEEEDFRFLWTLTLKEPKP